MARQLARSKYKHGKSLMIYPANVLIVEKDEKGFDRWFWLSKQTAIHMAKKILKTHKDEK